MQAIGVKRIVLGNSKPLRRQRPNWPRRLIVLGVLVAGGAVVANMQRSAPIAVRTHAVERGQVRDLVSSVTAGRITPEKEVTLRAELSGSVRELRHKRGSVVQAGEPLLVYDAQELRERRRAAGSAVALARAQAAEARANSQLSTKASERTGRLHETGSLSDAELDSARGRAQASQSAAEAAAAALAQAGANFNVARTALSRLVVRAPFAGLVLETSVDQGDTVSPGLQLLRLADTSKWYVDAEIDEADLGRVATGMRAEIALDAFQNQRIAGTLIEIAPSVNRDARGSRSLVVRVELSPDPRLRVGMSADVDIVASTRNDVVWIPPTAVMGRGAERSVYVVENGRAQKRWISPGISTWERVEISSGLRPGEQVIVSLSVPQLADGVPVQPEATGGARTPTESR